MNNIHQVNLISWYNFQCNRLFHNRKAYQVAILLYIKNPNDISLRLTIESIYNICKTIIDEVVLNGFNRMLFIEQSKFYMEN